MLAVRAMTTRRDGAGGGDHKNILCSLGFVSSRVTTPILAAFRSASPQAADLQATSLLSRRYHLASLSRSGVFRARTRTPSSRGRDVQQPKSFVWSPTRPANRQCPRRRSPIYASSILSDYWCDRPRGTSLKPKQIAGSETASRSKEVACYARFSSDNQRDPSIEDQLRLGRLHAEKYAGRSSTAIPTTRSAARRSCAPAFKS